jgi:hypothetical protein
MSNLKLQRRFGFERHTVVGQVGKLHILSSKTQSPVIVFTLEEFSNLDQAEKGFYQIYLCGEEAIAAFRLGIQTGDEVVLSLDELKPKAYLDPGANPPRPVPYLEGQGRDIFLLRRPGLESDVPQEPFNLDQTNELFDPLDSTDQEPHPDEKALVKKSRLNRVRLNFW